MHILVLAQTPPPVHGAALINKAVLEILGAHPNNAIAHLDISASKSITDMQKNVLSKAIKSFFLFIKVCLAAFAHKRKKTYINTAPAGLSSIRDYIFLTIASFRSTEVIAHFHGQLSKNSIFSKLPRTLFRSNITFIFLDSSLIPESFAKTHKRIKVLYNFAPNEISYKKIQRSRTEKITIGFLANMLPAKGIDYFLESCAFELRSGYDFSVLIAGAWTAKYEKSQYSKWISENSDISHKFTHYGSVDAVEKITFFRNIDIFFYPTKNDAFPLVLLEAMASGVAILANDTGAIKNIVADTELVCYANEASKKLRTLLDNPSILKEKQVALRHRYYTEYSRAQFEKKSFEDIWINSMKEQIKLVADHLPYAIGRYLAKLPMQLRLGQFNNQTKVINTKLNSCSIKTVHTTNINKLVDHAINNTVFYKKIYEEICILPASIRTFEDITKLPILTKRDFQVSPLKDRSAPDFALKKSNTGGTTGQPLDFYLEKRAYTREWAHMHAIWATLGYHFTDEKITIRGKNIGDRYYRYNFNQNEFLINAYASLRDNIDVCRDLILKRDIKWIHGYPSSVYSFLLELESVDSVLFEIFLKKIKGVFLGSEYPAPKYRDYIEKHCGLRSISWYGHSEMAVLAPEREPGSGVYYPFQSYGFTEAVSEGETYRLVATSTHNFATPFIRYDTGDLIDPTFKDGLLESFRIKEGRNSESVTDLNGRNISLTGLIFGRHHKAFEHSEHIQVRQPTSGNIEILITSKKCRDDWAELFDFSNAFFDVTFLQIDSPIRTPSGKVQLLLRPE